MRNHITIKLIAFCLILFNPSSISAEEVLTIHPRAYTSAMPGKPGSCTVWMDQKDPRDSLVIGSDVRNSGGIYTWSIKGHQIQYLPLQGVVGIDLRYDFSFMNEPTDLLVVAQNYPSTLRFFRVNPTTKQLEELTDSQGLLIKTPAPIKDVCLYQNPETKQTFAAVSMKSRGDISQYEIYDQGDGSLGVRWVQSVGDKDLGEVLTLCADDPFGYLYAVDETAAILKYNAKPKMSTELLERLDTGKTLDRSEAITLYIEPQNGYLVLSDPSSGTLHIYNRQGRQRLLKSIQMIGVSNVTGIQAISKTIPGIYPSGFILCQNEAGRNMAFFNWEDFFPSPTQFKQ